MPSEEVYWDIIQQHQWMLKCQQDWLKNFFKSLEFSTQDGPIEKNEDQFKIINNGFEFIIKDNNIDLGTIPLDKLEIYITTLIKLTKILNY